MHEKVLFLNVSTQMSFKVKKLRSDFGLEFIYKLQKTLIFLQRRRN